MWGRAIGNHQGRATCFTFVALCWGRAQRGDYATAWLLEGCLALAPFFSHFTHFPYATGAFPAVALVVNPRVGVFVYLLSLCGPFKQTLLKIWQFLLPQPPHCFLQSEVMEIYLPSTGTLGWVVWSGAGITPSQGIPPNFYPPHINVGLPMPIPLPLPPPPCATLCLCGSLPVSVTPLLLPVWMSVASLMDVFLWWWQIRF